jgi:hypothetical protein
MKRKSFFESKHALWSAAEAAPQAGKNTAGKLKGDHNWPFSITLPKTLVKDGQMFHLPHSFSDRGLPFKVLYTAEVRIVRGKLRADEKYVGISCALTANVTLIRVQCSWGYFSMRQPGPPSPLRQLAYQENSPLLGPDADPEGWYTLPPFSVKGMLFASRMIDAKCKVRH